MKLFLAEIRKLFGSKVILWLLIVLLAANFALTYYTSQPWESESTVARIYAEYLENPDEFDAYYEELLNIVTASIKEEPVLPSTYSENEKYDDFIILSQIYERSAYFAGYEATINEIIKRTETKISDLHSYGYSDRTYTTKSQIYQKAQYEALLQTIELQNQYVSGYDTYLKNHIVSAFILLFLTAAVSFVFLHDNSVGIDDILRVGKKGRLPTAIAKLSTALLTSVFATLLFLATTFLAVGLAQGFSSPLAPIQAFEAFATVPDAVSVLGYLLLHTGLRVCAFVVYGMLISAVAAARLPYIICFGTGGVFAGLNCVLFYRTYYGTPPVIRYFNFAAMSEVCALTDFYRTVSFFKIPIRVSSALLISAVIICLVSALLASILFVKNIRALFGVGGFLSRQYDAARKFIRNRFNKNEKRGLRTLKRPLWIFELEKIRPTLIFGMILLVLVCKGFYLDRSVGNMKSYSEAIYYKYITTIDDLDPDARQEYLDGERARIDNILDKYDSLTDDFKKGKISGEEYAEFLQSYYTAKAESSVFMRVENYAGYMKNQNISSRIEGKLIYSTGWERFFSLSPDYFLYFALIILCFQSFSVEYSENTSRGGFVQILRTAKRGRGRTFAVKLTTYLLLASSLAVIFRLTGFYAVWHNYDLPGFGVTLYSVESFGAVLSGITIWRYLVIDMLLQIFAAVILAGIIFIISFFFKKAFAILTVTLVATGIPALLVQTVLTHLSAFSILSMTSPQTLFCDSAQKSLLSMESGYLILVCVAYLAVTAAVVIAASNKYNGSSVLGLKKSIELRRVK